MVRELGPDRLETDLVPPFERLAHPAMKLRSSTTSEPRVQHVANQRVREAETGAKPCRLRRRIDQARAEGRLQLVHDGLDRKAGYVCKKVEAKLLADHARETEHLEAGRG